MTPVHLLADIGNTRVKLALDADGMLTPLPALVHRDPDWLAALDAQLVTLPAPATVRIAAVAGAETVAALVGAVAARWPTVPRRRARTRARLGGVRIAYADPARLGVDRALALVAVRDVAPVVVASLGTALAIDALAAEGEHLGGWIAPSPEAMQAAVLAGTAGVRREHAGTVRAFGCSTEDGLASGAWFAAAALVDRAAAELRARLGTAVALRLTGGGAAALAPLLRTPATTDPLLVLRGLAALPDEALEPLG